MNLKIALSPAAGNMPAREGFNAEYDPMLDNTSAMYCQFHRPVKFVQKFRVTIPCFSFV